ncbi:MAG: tRNA lysidine(34) synthetase TilS [Phycisphaerae bacterium]|nr:tRNA lysidine(34) synthetase TilS [Phycisphaerae bacterium]
MDFIRSEGLLDTGQSVLAAVSGGADSVVLLAVLKRLIEAHAFSMSLVVGHVNHGLRGAASDGDETFVKGLAARWGLDCCSRSVNIKDISRENRLSIETAARQVRMDTLIQMAEQRHCGAIATAHHMNDNAETLVHRLLRGTGLRGLAGIRPARTLRGGGGSMTFISPLLACGRSEIIAYCEENGLKWRHDHTNDDYAHTRNRIRHVLLPTLQQGAASDLPRQLDALSAACRRLLSRIERDVDALHPAAVKERHANRIILNRQAVAALVDPVAVELTRRALAEIGTGLRDMSESHYLAILEQARTGRPGRLSLPDGAYVWVHKNDLFFENPPPGAAGSGMEPRQLLINGVTEYGANTFETALLTAQECDLLTFTAAKDPRTEWFDYDTLAAPLVVRGRRPGDRFQPFGMASQKKVGKFLSAAGIGPATRRQAVIVADAGKIIWVAPVRPCESTKITPATRRILQIRLC